MLKIIKNIALLMLVFFIFFSVPLLYKYTSKGVYFDNLLKKSTEINYYILNHDKKSEIILTYIMDTNCSISINHKVLNKIEKIVVESREVLIHHGIGIRFLVISLSDIYDTLPYIGSLSYVNEIIAGGSYSNTLFEKYYTYKYFPIQATPIFILIQREYDLVGHGDEFVRAGIANENVIRSFVGFDEILDINIDSLLTEFF
ncbi:MAG: hypothetical protein ACNA8K_05565 [Cyclonatronaceae bacterium]